MEKNSPADDIKFICNAFLRFDKYSLQQLGADSDEYERDVTKNFLTILTTSCSLNFSESQSEKLRQAILNVFRRAQFDVETIAENGDTVTVKIKIGTFEKFTQDMAVAKLPPNAAKMSKEEQTDAIANAMADSLNEMQIKDWFEFTAECIYENEIKMWVPVDGEDFGTKITMKIWDFE